MIDWHEEIDRCFGAALVHLFHGCNQSGAALGWFVGLSDCPRQLRVGVNPKS